MNRGEKAEAILLAGNSHPELAKLIAERLCLKLSSISVVNKPNRETSVEIGCSVRAKDVYIIQTGTKNVNNDIMELMIIAYACKTSAARNIIGVIPYLPYSKQSKMRKRGCVVSKLLATMLNKAGLTHIITVDVHQKEVQGFYNCPVDNLRASPFLIQYIQRSIPDFRNSVIVAHNPNSVKRATSYAERLRLSIAVIHGEEKVPEEEQDDGRYSPPPNEQSVAAAAPSSVEPSSESTVGSVSTSVFSFGLDVFPDMPAKAKPPMNVVGDVGGKIAILVDDMVDDVESYISAAELLKERGAYKVYVIATHGLLSGEAPRMLEKSCVDEVVVTNTVPHELQKLQSRKIRTVDISVLLCEAIRRIHNFESMSYLFTNIAQED